MFRRESIRIWLAGPEPGTLDQDLCGQILRRGNCFVLNMIMYIMKNYESSNIYLF